MVTYILLKCFKPRNTCRIFLYLRKQVRNIYSKFFYYYFRCNLNYIWKYKQLSVLLHCSSHVFIFWSVLVHMIILFSIKNILNALIYNETCSVDFPFKSSTSRYIISSIISKHFSLAIWHCHNKKIESKLGKNLNFWQEKKIVSVITVIRLQYL